MRSIFRKKTLALLATGAIVCGQFSSAGGCLPNDYFAGLGGNLIELVLGTVIGAALTTAAGA